MKRPDKILDVFKTRSDEAAKIVGELRERRTLTLNAQVQVLQSIETAYNDARRDRSSVGAAGGYARRALKKASDLRTEAERIAEAELIAQDQLRGCFADQKRFELFQSQRQIKERAVARKREENRLLEEIDQLQAAKDREERG
ncbi:hypothetical protein HK107_13985 [Parvularcula sp. ZS-1/3]|uniref:Flagellar FliJ protein n=1 Tax=Parvularcula mediterranea TaxID=2732508 RepID=A0A7Y3W6E1_9PROT|nr:hypothetical protein [Parvularcula mediterranea]NNU17438.1 hypothetical protein [Parvularcula mediterranea]